MSSPCPHPFRDCYLCECDALDSLDYGTVLVADRDCDCGCNLVVRDGYRVRCLGCRIGVSP